MNKISRLLKSSPFLYSVYFYCLSFLLRVLGLFCRVEDNLILFNFSTCIHNYHISCSPNITNIIYQH